MTLHPLLPAAALALALAVPVAAQQSAPPPLNKEQQTLLKCSATFALVSNRQKAGDKAAMSFPDVTERGREYFIRAMVQLMDDAGLKRETIVTLVTDEAARLQDPAVLYAGMPDCLASLEASGL